VLNIIKLTKTPLIYSVSRFIWGAWSFILGAKSTKAPPLRRDWTEQWQTIWWIGAVRGLKKRRSAAIDWC